MRIILLFFTLFIYGNAGPIPESEQEQGIEEEQKRKLVTKDVIKSSFEKGFAKNENRTYEEPEFTATIRVQQEDVDVVVDFYKKKVFFGKKVDFDFTSNGTDTNFVFEAIVTSQGPKQELNFDVKGTINGQTINEKGKIMFQWDKITFKVKAGIDENTDGYKDMVAAFTECANLVTKTEGLTNDIAGRIEDDIYNSIMENWEKTFEIDTGKETKHGKSYNACRKMK